MMITLPAPLPDGDGDGRIVLSRATADRLGLPRGTVLIAVLPSAGTMTNGGWSYRVEGAPWVERPAAWALPSDLVTQTGSRRIAGESVTLARRRFSGGLMARSNMRATITGLTIRDIDATGAAGVLRVYSDSVADGVTMERIRMTGGRYAPGVARGVFMGGGRIDNVTIRDVVYEGGEPLTDPGDIYACVTLAGKGGQNFGSGFRFEHLDLRGFRTAYADATRYRNCDGIAIERGYSDGLISRVRIADADDGGIDLKGPRWRIEHATLENCARSIRRWSAGVDGPIASLIPTSAHLQAMGAGEWVIEHLQAAGNPTVPLVRFENGPTVVRILSWDTSGLDMARQVLAVRGDAPRGSCRLILPDGRDLTV